MPTPSIDNSVDIPSSHGSCPPEDDRSNWRSSDIDTLTDVIPTSPEIRQQPTPPLSDSHVSAPTDTRSAPATSIKQMDVDDENTTSDMLSPMSTEGEKHDEPELRAPTSALSSPSMGYDFSNIRVGLCGSQACIVTLC